MTRRWMGRYLAVYLAVPCGLALLYAVIYQCFRDSVHFYPFWLAESYFYPALPAVAILAWRVHWGKQHPMLYFLLSLVLLAGAGWIGAKDVAAHHGERHLERIIPIGLAEGSLLTDSGTYRIPYFPYDEERLIDAIRAGEPVKVWMVEEKGLLLAFADPAFASYTAVDRLLDVGLALLAFAVFAVFFWVVMGIWWREMQVEETEVLIRRWWKTTRIPLSDLIHVRLDRAGEEIRLETEEMVYNFPFEDSGAREMAAAADRTGMLPLQGEQRWVMAEQYRELQLGEDRLVCLGTREWVVPYFRITSLSWDSLIHITLDDETAHTITDRRYLDRGWFDELAARVKAVWEEAGLEYIIRVEPETGVLTLDLWEEMG